MFSESSKKDQKSAYLFSMDSCFSDFSPGRIEPGKTGKTERVGNGEVGCWGKERYGYVKGMDLGVFLGSA